ncbi:MAG: hypothetical protein ABJM29_17475 [Rhizobiaceae bacterium]
MSVLQSHIPHDAISPAWKDRLYRLAERLQAWRKRRRQQRIDRQAFQQMLYLDDHTLADIGYKRRHLEEADNLPIDVNAAEAARLIRRQHRLQNGDPRHF